MGAAALLAGCAVSKNPAAQGTLNPNYVKGSVKSIVMLPVLNAATAAVYHPMLQSELALYLQEKNKSLRFMATNEAMTRLMTGDGALQSRSLASDVFNQKPVDPASLKVVHDLLGVDAAVVCGFVDGSGGTLDMPTYIVDLRTGETIWSGVATGWKRATDKGHFAAGLNKVMEDGLVSLARQLPAL